MQWEVIPYRGFAEVRAEDFLLCGCWGMLDYPMHQRKYPLHVAEARAAWDFHIFPSHPLLLLYIFSDHRESFRERSHTAMDLFKSYQPPKSRPAFLIHLFPHVVSRFQKSMPEISTFVDFHSKCNFKIYCL